MNLFTVTEKHQSQIPALQLLSNLGYQILTPEQAIIERGNKYSNILLENILQEQLTKINKIHYRGTDYHFSEANIQEAIQQLKNMRYDGLLKTNEKIYDLITLGVSLEQTIEGNTKSYNLKYIDWENFNNNVFHVVPEFSVERSRSVETIRPDIVLFVNGIPLCVIECKSPSIDIEEAISQTIRNQDDDKIPKLFTFIQLVLTANKNTAKYATTGTSEKYWSVWNELEDKEDAISRVINAPLTEQNKDLLFTSEFKYDRKYFDNLEANGDRQLTEQDKAIYSLCRPERLLNIIRLFTLFDAGIKKIARYQQFFVVRSTLERIARKQQQGNRAGGIIWHTQGSGKSLTMVMLARALAFNVKNPRIILVTDRTDLDSQLGKTFTACGLTKECATSGRNLVKHLKNGVGIITTLINKFDKGWVSNKFVDNSADIFVLIDESHRTNFGTFAARMRQMLPNACYLGFTGTPLLKNEKKNNFLKFGELIEPHYSINQAVKDKAILPLLYESRHVEIQQNQAVIDLWFDRHTENLSKEQQADLKRKYARAAMLNKTDQVIYMRAFDISEHFRENWQGTGFKAQLVAPSKIAALKYHEYLKEIGYIESEVIISPPDTREGHIEVDEGPTDEVGKFWQKMMTRYGTEKEYNEKVIEAFKYSDTPEILIVVDKLLTGFDAPRNTVLYLCRILKEHTLLQAIARVNRLEEGKEYGYIIDYASTLGELDKALTMYNALEGYDEEDIAGALTSIYEEVRLLAQKHSDLWDIFKEIKNKQDMEEFERLLGDAAIREDFYHCLSQYSKTLAIALSTEKFLNEIDEKKLYAYKTDLKNFQKLKAQVKQRYAESIDYRDYEPKIKKLLDMHIQASEVLQLHERVNIFDENSFNALKQNHEKYLNKSAAAKADMISHALKKVIYEKMDEDPIFYEKFSKLIQQAIDDFRLLRISDLDYLSKANDLRDKVVSKKHEDVPASISDNDEACAYYGIIRSYFMKYEPDNDQIDMFSAETALAVQKIIESHWKVDFWTDENVQKSVINDIDDFLYDEVKIKFGITFSLEQLDEIIAKTMQIAKSRRHAL